MPDLPRLLTDRPHDPTLDAPDFPSAHGPQPAGTLARQIESLTRRGQVEQAERIAGQAGRWIATSRRLCAAVARLRVRQGRLEEALLIVDGFPGHRSSRLRRLRIAILLLMGRRGEAHLELNEWARRSDAPPETRIVLGLIESGEGDRERAIATLLRNRYDGFDSETLAALLAVHGEHGRRRACGEWADQFGPRIAASVAPDFVPIMIETCTGKAPARPGVPTPQQVRQLAMEVTGSEAAIPALVESLAIEMDVFLAEWLYRAIEAALAELERFDAACEALARLALLLNRPEQAVEWVNTGLERHPMSASLARMRAAILETDDSTAGPRTAAGRRKAA